MTIGVNVALPRPVFLDRGAGRPPELSISSSSPSESYDSDSEEELLSCAKGFALPQRYING